jgi:hypothetical protein
MYFWSHYADSHKGFAVEYFVKNFDNKNLFPVHYSSDLIHEDLKLLIHFIKSTDWASELEWRIILENAKSACEKCDKSKFSECDCRFSVQKLADYGMEITGVYLGLDFDFKLQENIDLIDVCKEKGVDVWKSKIAEKQFKIEFEKFV